jgi:Ca2+-binding RTX toxin-like protein
VTLPGPGSYSAGTGNDTVFMTASGETVRGGPGNDTYHVEASGDTVIENPGEGIDTVVTASLPSFMLPANVENLTHTGSSGFVGIGNELGNVLIGGSGSDYLIGLDGNDKLLGGEGAPDTLQGGTGNDVYFVESAGSSIVEFANEGIDSVQTWLSSYELANNVENLTHTGSANFVGMGNAGDNILIGGLGNDYLIGGGGNDTMLDAYGLNSFQGGTGDDLYMVQQTTDTVIEFANEGNDTVETFLLQYALPTNVENLVFVGGSSHTGIGNAAANVITGSSGDDIFTGGGGNDVFNYRLSGNGLDTITDFNADNSNAGEHDHIDLSGRGLTFASLAVTAVTGGVTVGIPGGDAIFLKGAVVGSIDAGDFFF